ncbi:hypothetical protein BD311DRAFT_768442 [Dichomitus squalens]|uniref:Uncharacterized protein n=1 Tax=Dichomitus squalens TaxID=114155 RepID=A0A4Q9MAZ4_9APHY|nr:hypothetical protein BD311DRAFT_768442 [Dichomitus squalens]
MIVKTLRLSTLHPRPFLCPQRSPLPPLSVHANRAVAAHAQTLLSASGGVCHLSTLEDRFDYDPPPRPMCMSPMFFGRSLVPLHRRVHVSKVRSCSC